MTQVFRGLDKNTATYQRFLKVPTILSLVVLVALFILLTEAIWILMPLRLWWLSILINGVAFVVADLTAFQASKVMLRRRLWEWGRNRFDSWSEMRKFIESTPGWKLEKLAAEESWDDE